MRKDLAKIPIYQPISEDFLNLATNENFSINYEDITEFSLGKIVKSTPFHQYGQSRHIELLEKYATYLNVLPEQLLPAPGSESLIAVLLNSLVTDTLLTFDIDFFRYSEVAYILGKNHLRVPIVDGVKGLIEVAKDSCVQLIMLSNPNNPLGIAHSQQELIALLDATECYVVIDEAYSEYYGKSLVQFIEKYPKLIVLKTMSKAWGLARLRVGFMVANAELNRFVTAIQGPFVLSDLNANLAAYTLKKEMAMREAVEKTKNNRANFVQFLQAYDVYVYPSEANFVYVKTNKAKQIVDALFEDKIIVLLMPDGLRITIGTQEQMEILKMKLAKYLPK